MKRRLNLWLTRFQERRRTRRLLRQWRSASSRRRLVLLPLRLLLTHQLRCLEAYGEAVPGSMVSNQAPPKLWQRIGRRIGCGCSGTGPGASNLSRRRSPPPVWVVKLQRRGLVWLSSLVLMALRRPSPGTSKR